MYLGNIVGLIVVLTTVPWWAAILRIPFAVIAPVIIVVCSIGAYTVHSSMFDVAMMLVFGVFGYLFKKLHYPMAPLVLALVLGDMAETNFRQSMLSSQGALNIFWANPLVGTLMGLSVIMLLLPVVGALREHFRKVEAAEVALQG
jgi:putative tricarboxylic transport membrane protein